MPYTEFALKLY